MKETFYLPVVVFLLLIGIIPTNSSAYQFTGEWMFNVDGNDPSDASSQKNIDSLNSLELKIESWFNDVKGLTRDIELEYYDRVNAPDGNSGLMSVTYSDNNMYGTWSTSTPVEFYTVKASSQYAIYWIAGGASSGDWTTEHLTNNGDNQPTVSHLSSYNPSDPVPEPSTMILFGTGLAVLTRIKRTKNKLKQ